MSCFYVFVLLVLVVCPSNSWHVLTLDVKKHRWRHHNVFMVGIIFRIRKYNAEFHTLHLLIGSRSRYLVIWFETCHCNYTTCNQPMCHAIYIVYLKISMNICWKYPFSCPTLLLGYILGLNLQYLRPTICLYRIDYHLWCPSYRHESSHIHSAHADKNTFKRDIYASQVIYNSHIAVNLSDTR